MKELTLYLFICAIFIVGSGCSSHEPYAQSTITNSQTAAVPVANTAATPKAELTKIYTKAIAEYIKAVYKNDKTVFDTLFFGKHVYGQPDDFPDIELPATIEKTNIRLITPELGAKLQKERKSLVYINMMGWVEEMKAEFILVTFTNGGEHKFDCFINYKYDEAQKEFELENLRFEYFDKGVKK